MELMQTVAKHSVLAMLPVYARKRTKFLSPANPVTAVARVTVDRFTSCVLIQGGSHSSPTIHIMPDNGHIHPSPLTSLLAPRSTPLPESKFFNGFLHTQRN